MQGTGAIAEILKREGVEFIVCFPHNDLIEACARVGIRPIVCRQERVGLAIADGFSRTTHGERIGVFVMQHGPGAENAFPGVAQAYADNVPLLVLPAGEPMSRQGVKPVFSACDNFAHITKWRALVTSPDRIAASNALKDAHERYGANFQGGDYAAVATALGAWGRRVEHPGDFGAALDEAITVTKSGQPALIDCIVKAGYIWPGRGDPE